MTWGFSLLVIDSIVFPIIACVFFTELFLVLFIPYLYLTSIPDVFPVALILIAIAVITGGSMDLEKPGVDALLPPFSEWGKTEEEIVKEIKKDL